MSKKEVEKFEQQFEKEEMELTVLMKSGCNGACVSGEWLIPSVNFVASIDQVNNLSQKKADWSGLSRNSLIGKDFDMILLSMEYITFWFVNVFQRG